MYLRFAPIVIEGHDHWDVLRPTVSAKPIARVSLDKEGRCTYAITSDRTLSAGELATLNIFMKSRERED